MRNKIKLSLIIFLIGFIIIMIGCQKISHVNGFSWVCFISPELDYSKKIIGEFKAIKDSMLTLILLIERKSDKIYKHTGKKLNDYKEESVFYSQELEQMNYKIINKLLIIVLCLKKFSIAKPQKISIKAYKKL